MIRGNVDEMIRGRSLTKTQISTLQVAWHVLLSQAARLPCGSSISRQGGAEEANCLCLAGRRHLSDENYGSGCVLDERMEARGKATMCGV